MFTLVGLLFNGCLSKTTEELQENGDSIEEDNESEPSSSIMVSEEEAKNQKNKVAITLYFVDNKEAKLVEEKRFIPKDKMENVEEAAQIALDELFKGPIDGNLSVPFPDEVEVPNVKINGDIATVDFSKEFVEKHPGGTTGETLTIYSIVNTLNSIEGINGVQFTIEGEKSSEFKGHVEFDKVFRSNTEE